MLVKGSREWFDAIIAPVKEVLIGIEVSHHPHNVNVSPRCQVTFVFREFFLDRLAEEVRTLEGMVGFRMYHWVIRGQTDKMRSTAAFDFRDDEACPQGVALQVAEELGFTAAPSLLNHNSKTARYLPNI